MIRNLFFFFSCTLIIGACSSSEKPKGTVSPAKNKVKTNLTSNFQDYFQKLDTAEVNYSVGCISGFYQLLDDQYVVRIDPNLNFEYDDLMTYQLGENSIHLTIELLEFKKGEANLTNCCTDLHVVNVAEPVVKYTNCTGTVIVGKSDPTDNYGTTMPKVSIHLDKVTFYDPLGTEKLKLDNELIWKVLHRGTPG